MTMPSIGAVLTGLPTKKSYGKARVDTEPEITTLAPVLLAAFRFDSLIMREGVGRATGWLVRARWARARERIVNQAEAYREAVTAITSRIDVLDSQLARASGKIIPIVFEKFSQQLSAKLHDEDSSLRSAYLRMLVYNAKMSKDCVTIPGSKSVLERGLAKGLPRLEGSVPVFDQKWCRLGDSNT